MSQFNVSEHSSLDMYQDRFLYDSLIDNDDIRNTGRWCLYFYSTTARHNFFKLTLLVASVVLVTRVMVRTQNTNI